MAKKSNNELISAILYIILGVLLIVFKGATLGWAMTIAGIVFIVSGVLDVVRKNFDKTVEWIDVPEAEQYRQSLLLIK